MSRVSGVGYDRQWCGQKRSDNPVPFIVRSKAPQRPELLDDSSDFVMDNTIRHQVYVAISRL